MNINRMLTKLLFVLLFLPADRNAADCSAECQLENVTNYFTALDEVYREGSTIADIDHLLSILHEDVRYVHADYEADFDRASWREAFIRNLKRGAYRNGTENEIRITNIIHGKNHIAVEYSHGVVQSDGFFQSNEPLLVLFTFTEGKISKLRSCGKYF